MHKLTLTYFDFHGGRGEPARLAMTIGGIEFEDRRIPLSEWPKVKSTTPLHAVPVLTVDGTEVTQSNTINRFVGKLAGLYPTDPWQAALCDEVMDAVEDVVSMIVTTFFIGEEDEKRAAREALVIGPIPLYLERLASMLDERGGQYFSDNRLAVADLKVFVWVRGLRSGNLDHVPQDLVDRKAPQLVAHHDRIAGDSAIKAYYEKHR